MDYRTEIPEYGAEAAPSNSSEYLRALKRGNASQPPLVHGSPPPVAPAAIPAICSSPAAEKRRSPRYKCEGSAEFRTEGIDVRTWARVTDISCNGCYVEMQATSSVNTAVSMVLEVNGIRVRLKGTVRTSYPLLGMGIEFSEITDEGRTQLEELLLRLAGDASPPPEIKSRQSTSVVPDLLMIMDAGAALNAVARFFQNNQALTREQFTELIGESQNRDRGERR